MQAEGWKRRIGEERFNSLLKVVTMSVQGRSLPEDTALVSAVLTQAWEVGFRTTEQEPKIDPRGTKVFWPVDDKMVPVLTTEGLIEYWRSRGHSWVLLRMEQLARGCAGPLAARLQEILAVYEEQCRADAVETLPDGLDCTIFVGGEDEMDSEALIFALLDTP